MAATSGPGSGAYTAQEFHFADFTLDQSSYRLQRGERLLRLEKLPMELLILLVERRGELVSREDIAGRLWGKDVFLDVDHSINTAISKVRVVLRDDPEKPRFVETVVGKGYRFAAPVTCNNGDSNSQPEPVPRPAQVAAVPVVLPTEKKIISIRRRVLLGGIAVLALLTVALVISRGGAKSIRQPVIKSLAVLPLKNLSGDPNQEYLAEGMTEALIGQLSSIRDLRVVSHTSVMGFKDTRMSAPEIAKALHVDALVEGSVIRDGNRIRVTAQLIRAATDEHFWSETYDRELGDALVLNSEVAQAIARKVEVTATGKERASLVATRHIAPEVYESYLRGQFALKTGNSKANIEESIGYFAEAIKKDPTFAPAYVSMATAYGTLGTPGIGGDPPSEVRPKAFSTIRKALELDPTLPEAHVVMGWVYQQQWQWSDAEREYKLALELNPNDAGVHLAFARLLLHQGRAEEAQAWIQRARELDPLGVTGMEMGWFLFESHHYEEATRELRSDLAVHPDDYRTYWVLGHALIANGRPDEAIPVLAKALALSGRSPAIVGTLITAYACAGRRTEALRLLDELKGRQQKGYVPAAAFVNAYLGLGDDKQTYDWLEQAYKERSGILQFVRVYPLFDPLRSDPRFADLVRRVGLPQ